MGAEAVSAAAGRWPVRLFVGAGLVACCWPLNWLLPGTPTAYLFFPLWLGYILVVDAFVWRRRGTSLWTRSWPRFALLFAASAPAWWLFELINRRTANWEYLGAERFSNFEYHLLSTIAFSTVMPAVFESAELARSFRWIDDLPFGKPVRPSPRLAAGLFAAGLGMGFMTLAWPRHCYPFVWISLALLLEPLNRLLGRGNLLEYLQQGDWRPLLSLAVGSLMCGFCWELWNFYSWPKWVYHTPGAQVLHVFEMPLPGYGGYVPFALELFGLKNLLLGPKPGLNL